MQVSAVLICRLHSLKVIYVARNPKDVLVSYFHFHKIANMLETPKDFDDFFEKFLRGNGKRGPSTDWHKFVTSA